MKRTVAFSPIQIPAIRTYQLPTYTGDLSKLYNSRSISVTQQYSYNQSEHQQSIEHLTQRRERQSKSAKAYVLASEDQLKSEQKEYKRKVECEQKAKKRHE